MNFLGRFQLGDIVPLFLLARTAGGTPSPVAAPPTVEVWSSAGDKVVSKEMPIIDRYTYDGTFLLPVALGAGFVAGVYTVVYHFTIGSYYGIETANFEVMPGGHTDGTVVSMYFYERPQARFIVQQLDSGLMIQGRNPSL